MEGTNVIRHSSATHVSIGLTITDAAVTIAITDNGNPAWPIEEGHGLTGLREPLAQHGGTLDLNAKSTIPGLALSAVLPHVNSSLNPEHGART